MDSSSAIVTLQIGTVSNYLCTHYWNIQQQYLESTPHAMDPIVSPGVLLYSSRGYGDTVKLMPRTVIIDDRDAVAFRVAPKMVEEARDEANWNNVTVVSQPRGIEISLVDSLDKGDDIGTVKRWTDYLDIVLHPLSLYLLPPRFEVSAFNYHAGSDTYTNDKHNDDGVLMKCRRMIEECDSFMGIQCVFDGCCSWSGYTTSLLLDIYDDFAPPSTLSLSVSDNNDDNDMSTVCKVKEIKQCVDMGSLYIPIHTHITNPYLHTSTPSQWFDSVTVPFRTHQSCILDMNNACRDGIGLPCLNDGSVWQGITSDDDGSVCWSVGRGVDSSFLYNYHTPFYFPRTWPNHTTPHSSVVAGLSSSLSAWLTSITSTMANIDKSAWHGSGTHTHHVSSVVSEDEEWREEMEWMSQKRDVSL